MHAPRETRRTRDAKGLPRVFRSLVCLSPKVGISRSLEDKCFPFFFLYVCTVLTSFLSVLVVTIFVSQTSLEKAQNDYSSPKLVFTMPQSFVFIKDF